MTAASIPAELRDRGAQRCALRLFLAAIAGREPHNGLVEIRWPERPNDRDADWHSDWHPVDDHDALVAAIEALARRTDVFVGVCPRTRRSGKKTAVARSWLVWVDVDGADALARLDVFQPQPRIVVRSGRPDGAHAYWPLREPLTVSEVERANMRLIAHIGADERCFNADRIMRPPTSRNHKPEYGLPAPPVLCSRMTVREPAPTVAEVLEHVPELPDEPPPKSDAEVELARVRRKLASTPGSVFYDPLAAIPAEEYVPLLTGQQLGRDRKVRCPFHDDWNPSLHVYPGDRGWTCFQCGKGGTVIDFGAALYGLEPRGAGFHEIRRRLVEDILGRAA